MRTSLRTVLLAALTSLVWPVVALSGAPLYTIHAEHAGGLDYALAYAEGADGVITIGEAG